MRRRIELCCGCQQFERHDTMTMTLYRCLLRAHCSGLLFCEKEEMEGRQVPWDCDRYMEYWVLDQSLTELADTEMTDPNEG